MNMSIKLTDKQKVETDKAFEFLLSERKDFEESVNDVNTPEEKFNEIFNYFTWYLLGICDCGCPDSSIKCIRDYLSIIKMNHDENFDKAKCKLKEIFKVDNICSDPLLQFMAYTLDDKKLSDHGCNISGAWITDLGKVLLWCYNIYIIDRE